MVKYFFNTLIKNEETSEGITFESAYGNNMEIIFITILIWFILGFILALVVYKDAQKRFHNENFWLIFVFILSIIGFLIYIFFREEEISIEDEIDHDKPIQSL